MDLLYYAFMNQENPMVIRYPRGLVSFDPDHDSIKFDAIKPVWTELSKGNQLTIIGYGPSLNMLMDAKNQTHVDARVINARFIKPMDEAMLHDIMKAHTPILVYEEQTATGSLYPQILAFMAKHHYSNRITSMSLTEQIIHHGKYKEVLKKHDMDLDAVKKTIKELIQ
jgi:1-deoxy-D-xylulose-5-phosphate synthase